MISTLLALKLIKKVGNKTLLEIAKNNIDSKMLLKMPESGFRNIFCGKEKTVIAEIKQDLNKYLDISRRLLESYSNKNINVISYEDRTYPKTFRLLKDAPVLLFAKGNKSLLNELKAVAVVGTRNCTEIGGKLAFNAARYFASKRYTIVSGLAKGIDTFAHKAALQVKGSTVAVVVDVEKISPKENHSLSRDMLKNKGLLLAENMPGVPIRPYHFVQRNRLQVALSLAVFPIETDLDGGTMKTAEFAVKQDRLIFCPDSTIYYDKVIPELKGIKKLIDERKAGSYTEKDYFNIEASLKSKEKQIINKIKDFDTQRDLFV